MFSPDGRWAAYHSNDSGRQEVYVRPFPDPGGKGADFRVGPEPPPAGRAISASWSSPASING